MCSNDVISAFNYRGSYLTAMEITVINIFRQKKKFKVQIKDLKRCLNFVFV